jgi:hypothetical protein
MDTLRSMMLTCGSSGTKRLIKLLSLLVFPPAWAPAAYADNVTTFIAQTNIDITAGAGGADAASIFEGPGISLSAQGNAACAWCGAFLTPGSSLNPSFSFVDFSSGSGTLTFGGQQVGCDLFTDCSLSGTGITAFNSLRFPTNGQNFTVTEPAAIAGMLSGQVGTQPLLFSVQTSTGQLALSFAFNSLPFPSYQFEQAVFSTSTPEPGTFALMAAGLAAILGVSKRRKLL